MSKRNYFDRFRRKPEPEAAPAPEPEAPAEPEPLFRITQQPGTDIASVWAMLDGRSFVTDSTNPHFPEIVARLTGTPREARYEAASLADLFDPAYMVARRFTSLSERVSVSGGHVYFDGEAVTDALGETIVRGLVERADVMPLVRFMERLFDNPNRNSREQLFPWLAKGGFSVTEDGYMLAYKGVYPTKEEGVYQSLHAGNAMVNDVEYLGAHIPQRVGDVVWMPRSAVDSDVGSTCSVGLHAGRHGYASGYGSNVLLVKIDPRDVVSVPHDGHEKIRCCRYEVIADSAEQIDTVFAAASDMRGLVGA